MEVKFYTLLKTKNFIFPYFRYIMGVRISDASGEAWLSVFNEQAEKIIGCPADELDSLKSQVMFLTF